MSKALESIPDQDPLFEAIFEDEDKEAKIVQAELAEKLLLELIVLVPENYREQLKALSGDDFGEDDLDVLKKIITFFSTDQGLTKEDVFMYQEAQKMMIAKLPNSNNTNVKKTLNNIMANLAVKAWAK